MKVHLIGNAHLDPVWLWRWEEGCAEALATFQSALERMEEFPDYVFTCAGAAYYEWVREIDPAMFEKIRARVREGRWVIVGGWWIQPDCNAPCGESFARHALLSQRFYQKMFGVTCKTGYNVDSFGHNAMLPQLLTLSGMTGYVYMRPGAGAEKQYPFPQNAFWWAGADGTKIKTFRIPDGYAAFGGDECVRKAKDAGASADELGIPEMCFYGVGNHGGGPTIDNLNHLDAIASDAIGYSSPDAYFADLTDDLPVLQGDLQHHASGCYTAVMMVKALNRLAEGRLLEAEKLQLLAKEAGALTRYDSLEQAWKNVLFNQFHDVMGGCSIRAAYDDAREAFGESLSAASRALNRAMQSVARAIDTSMGRPLAKNTRSDWRWFSVPGRGTPVVVFNPFSWTLRAPIRSGARFACLMDDEGQRVPMQRVRSGVTNGAEDKFEDMFVAEVPPMGWRTYELYADAPGEAASLARSLRATDTTLENDFIRVSFDPATGAMVSFFDKTRGAELLRAPARDVVVDETKSDTWAHAIFRFRDDVGTFGDAKVQLLECGDVCAILRVTNSWGQSEIEKTYTLYRALPQLRSRVRVFWREKHKMLKWSFPTAHEGEVACSIPFGFLNRPQDGDEWPMQGWVRMGGLGFASDSRAAYDAENGDLRVTILRSPIFADHFGVRDDRCEYSEQGEQTFECTLFALDGESELLAREADALTCPPEFLVISHHAGKLPARYSALDLGANNLAATTLKYAEDGRGAILRVHETQGRAVHARLTLMGASWEADFRPQQIRTFRLFEGKAEDVNLIEE